VITADTMIMDEHQAVAAIVDRLAAEFAARTRHEVERVVGESWDLFSASRDVVLRVVVTEWYARTQLIADSNTRQAS
jgi:hypothetical protein